jgi:hypothetical protein
MNNKVFKIVYAVIVAIVLLALVAFMTVHVCNGLTGPNAQLLLGGYVLMLIWAGMRLYSLIKDIIKG